MIWLSAESLRVTTPVPPSVVLPTTESWVRLPEDLSAIVPSLTIDPTSSPLLLLRIVTVLSLVRSCSPAKSASVKSPGPLSLPPTIRVPDLVITTVPPVSASITPPSLINVALFMVRVLPVVARSMPVLRRKTKGAPLRLTVKPEAPTASTRPSLSRPRKPAPRLPEPRTV